MNDSAGIQLRQQISPPPTERHIEGIGFSACGRLLVAAQADRDRIALYRRASPAAMFEAQPYCVLSDPDGRIAYPHDAAFSPDERSLLLAVAQRTDSLLIYRRRAGTDEYGPHPAAVISGVESGLEYSDGVAFVPPQGDQLAACNLSRCSVSFYAVRVDGEAVQADIAPTAVLEHDAIIDPDGIGFSADGEFLALANHGNHSVVIFRRNHDPSTRAAHPYGPEPACLIRDPHLRFPHSVAFTASGHHLLVTNAGANHVGLYLCNRYGENGVTWSRHASTTVPIANADVFRRANQDNAMEGGPKGIATRADEFAVCSPQVGIMVFNLKAPATVVSDGPVFGIGRDHRPRQAPNWFRHYSPGEDATWIRRNWRSRHKRPKVRLNPSSQVLRELCDGETTVAEMIATLADHFPDAPHLEDDVYGALQSMETRGLIEP